MRIYHVIFTIFHLVSRQSQLSRTGDVLLHQRSNERVQTLRGFLRKSASKKRVFPAFVHPVNTSCSLSIARSTGVTSAANNGYARALAREFFFWESILPVSHRCVKCNTSQWRGNMGAEREKRMYFWLLSFQILLCAALSLHLSRRTYSSWMECTWMDRVRFNVKQHSVDASSTWILSFS